MRVYKRHGGRFFRASFSLITQRYHPRAWLISLYASCHAPKIIREYFAGCSEDICWFFLCFWQKAESARYQIGKKFCETPAVQRSCYLFFGEFLMNLLARLLSQLFLPQTLWFFWRGVGGVNFFVFLLHNDYLKPVFFYLAQRGERRFVVDIGSLSSSPTAWLKKNIDILANIHWISSFQIL